MQRSVLFIIVALLCVSNSAPPNSIQASELIAEEPAEATVTTEEAPNRQPVNEDEERPQQAPVEHQPQRKTYVVRPQPLQIEASVEGTFAAAKLAEVGLRPEAWSEFEIQQLVAHGTRVQPGDTLLEFDGEKLLDAIADLEIDLHVGELKINRAEQEILQQEQSLQRQLADAEESVRRAEEDLQRYQATERALAIDSIEMYRKTAKFYLDYYRDELEQLEKMYEADELTEETEEIVLRRQRFYVEAMQFSYESAIHFYERTLHVTIPRRDRDLAEQLKVSRAELERARTASQVDLDVARYEIEKLKRKRQQARKRHVRLLADKSRLVLKAPAAGIVYYGACEDGKWSKLDYLRGKLLPGKKAETESVLMTVVDTSSLHFLIKLDGKYLLALQPGVRMDVEPTVEGAEKITGTVASISAVPVSEGKFAAQITFATDLPEWLVPGISGKVSLVTYKQQDALLVPATAVHREDGIDKRYVWRVQGDEVEKVSVETGKTKDKVIQITSGLAPGDVISLDDQQQKTSHHAS